MKKRFVAVAAVALSLAPALAVPRVAGAQPVPAATPYPIPSLPPNVHLDDTVRQIMNAVTPLAAQYLGNRLNSNVGTVSFYKGFEMQIDVGANRYTNVHLHRGTTIDPRGETIRVGDLVDVGGRKEQDGSLDANAITIRH